jgi:hypothetical protein
MKEDKTNAKQELLAYLKDKARVRWASLSYGEPYLKDCQLFVLRVGYTPEEFDAFLNSLNFNYDSGFGGQNLFGLVCLEDDTWLDRGEYDGSEWWQYMKLPEIPKECIRND